MKRLTERRKNGAINVRYATEHETAIHRLAAIEDILCDSVGDNDPDAEDEYDLDRLAVMCNQRMSMRDEVSQRFSLTAKIPLDRLRELVELYKNVPHICDYCIGCEIEPTDGHGCYGYDNFVFSVRRIVAALKAREQDG